MKNNLKFKQFKIIIILSFLNIFSQSLNAGISSDRISKDHWKNLEIIWLEEDRFPTYNISIYFADGALSDRKNLWGETELMFNHLKSGTHQFDQNQISNTLEFYGVAPSANVTHEYSSFSFSGLAKDIVPTLNMVCHLFQNATFPTNELNKTKKRMKNALENIISSPSSLADRAFRSLSLEGTPYYHPTEGMLKSINKISSSDLKEKLDFFNKKVKKKIYLTGPKQLLAMKEIFLNECGWDLEKSNYVRKISSTSLPPNSPDQGPLIYLVPVPENNQAQIRIGRFLNHDEIKKPELMSLTSSFLGGGFTSKLMQELRVKRGLTYSAGVNVSPQRDYGRMIVTTFTQDKSLVEAMTVIKETLEDVGSGKFAEEELQKAISYASGRYLFGFEKNSAFLLSLLYYDHMGKSYDDMFNYPHIIQKISLKEIAQSSKELFDWNKQTIVIVGHKNLIKTLNKLGRVRVVSYEKFL